jgi:hypothetical protein
MPDTLRRGEGVARARRPLLLRIPRRLYRLSNQRRTLLFQAVASLALARLALIFVPFRKLAERFGTATPPDKATQAFQARLDVDQAALVRDIGWAVTRAARYVPFRAVCLPQAIAAQRMLSRRDIASVMHFGVAKKAGEEMGAHAWLDADGIEVTGYPVGPEFVEVARFL